MFPQQGKVKPQTQSSGPKDVGGIACYYQDLATEQVINNIVF